MFNVGFGVINLSPWFDKAAPSNAAGWILGMLAPLMTALNLVLAVLKCSAEA